MAFVVAVIIVAIALLIANVLRPGLPVADGFAVNLEVRAVLKAFIDIRGFPAFFTAAGSEKKTSARPERFSWSGAAVPRIGCAVQTRWAVAAHGLKRQRYEYKN